MDTCSVEGCERRLQIKSRGLCQMHYMRLRRTGTLEARPRGRPSKYSVEERVCQVCGAQFTYRAVPGTKGLYCSRRCSNQATKNGRFRHGPDHPNWKGGHVESHGYRQIWVNGGEKRKLVLEHRHVMEQSLGRPIDQGETVHHRNGDRLDNRIENLELWSSRHPRGQRVEDLLTFAHEIIALYA